MAKKSTAVDNGTSENPVVNQAQIDAELKLQELKEQQKKLAEQIKATKAEAKGIKPKKELKGVMVTFTNKAGETITGLGNLYYVVRSGGKLHYKEQNAVRIMDEAEVATYNEQQAALKSA